MTYLYEGFRGINSSILVDYNNKYIQRELTKYEKESLNKLLKVNNNTKFYSDIYSTLIILMHEIIKDNYDQNHSIYKIIESLPNYIILNEALIKLFKSDDEKNPEEKIFTVNSLVSIFEIFEGLCWNEIKKNIPIDYQLEVPEETKKYILQYFDKIDRMNEDKLINKKLFTTSLRRLISRYLAGSSEEVDIKSNSSLKLYLGKEDLWNKQITENDKFEEEIYEFCKDDILIGHCWDIYNLLDGDLYLNEILDFN